MTEHDLWKIHPRMPRKVRIGDITIRDGFQHLEKFISTRAKIYYLEELVFAGCREIEVTNLGNAYLMPQFRDAEAVLAHARSESFRKRCEKRGIKVEDITFTAITIRESAVDQAVELRKRGIGPGPNPDDGLDGGGAPLCELGMHPSPVLEGSRTVHPKMRDAGMKMCGTVSTIWGSPIGGATDMKDAVEFTKRWLEIGAYDIEHADHDGSASAADVYRYFSMVVDAIPDPDLHVAHFHETKRIASASVLAALGGDHPFRGDPRRDGRPARQFP